MAPDKPRIDITANDIATFLQAAPQQLADLLAADPAFLETCLLAAGKTAADSSAPNHEKLGKVVDLTPALAAKARQEARRLTQTNQSLLHVAAENMLSWTRLHHATLGLLASPDLDGLVQVITTEFPIIFDLTECQLIIESESYFDGAATAGLVIHATDSITKVISHRGLYLGAPSKAAHDLLIKPAKSLAMIRLPDRLPSPVSSCVLLLGGKTSTSFQPDLGSDLLILLAELVGVALAAQLDKAD